MDHPATLSSQYLDSTFKPYNMLKDLAQKIRG